MSIQSEEIESLKDENDTNKSETSEPIENEEESRTKKLEMEKIAKEYYSHLNGTLSFIMLGIYFSIIELDYFQVYAILTSILFTIYLTFNFKEYSTVANEYLAQFSGFEKIRNALRLFIFFIAFFLLLTAAFGFTVLKSLSNWLF
ncbi:MULTISPECIES: hypothetical protein [unclassified Acinetobacter]|uniref:hypothetical protein n=1 Tax=unclassified Acinetobacter TaxID=196816 RepID=UPI00045341FD|nr:MULTISPECIES: hypothetical protein [unclassified Acinetobacter]EZQ01325.1 hypothetical protein CL42_14205 [Acinetobacter sp. Ver3]